MTRNGEYNHFWVVLTTYRVLHDQFLRTQTQIIRFYMKIEQIMKKNAILGKNQDFENLTKASEKFFFGPNGCEYDFIHHFWPFETVFRSYKTFLGIFNFFNFDPLGLWSLKSLKMGPIWPYFYSKMLYLGEFSTDFAHFFDFVNDNGPSEHFESCFG